MVPTKMYSNWVSIASFGLCIVLHVHCVGPFLLPILMKCSVCAVSFFFLQFIFDFQSGDIFGSLADLGWMAGHSSVVYGPLCNGATSVLFESVATYPDCGTCKQYL